MKIDLLLSSIIVSSAILVDGALYSNSPKYQYETIKWSSNEERFGWLVRIELKTGDRCLMNEGAVRDLENWRAAARNYVVPLNLCNSK